MRAAIFGEVILIFGEAGKLLKASRRPITVSSSYSKPLNTS